MSGVIVVAGMVVVVVAIVISVAVAVRHCCATCVRWHDVDVFIRSLCFGWREHGAWGRDNITDLNASSSDVSTDRESFHPIPDSHCVFSLVQIVIETVPKTHATAKILEQIVEKSRLSAVFCFCFKVKGICQRRYSSGKYLPSRAYCVWTVCASDISTVVGFSFIFVKKSATNR